MEKIAFKMKLKPGFKDEYKKRHDEIWPVLRSVIKENKISDYTIFLDEETDTLLRCRKTRAAVHPRKWAKMKLYENGGNTWPILWKPMQIIRRLRCRW